jgi:HEAT repeat protein
MSQTDDLVLRLRSGDPDAQVGAALDLMSAGNHDGLPELIALTHSPDVAVRATAARALGELGTSDTEAAGRALLALAGDPEALVRSEAVDALGILGYVPAAEAVGRALSDVDALVRASAAETAGDLGDLTVVPALERALDDPDQAVRAYAADSLGRLGADDLLERLRERASSDPSARVRAELHGARHRLGAPDALDALATLLAQAGDEDADALLNVVADLAERSPSARLTDGASVRDALEQLADRLPRVRPHVDQIVALLTS